MALPDNFSPWEHLQSVLMMVHNRRVRREFSDVGGDDWNDDINTPRGSLRTACTLRDDDSAIISFHRLFLFYVMLRHAVDIHPPMYTLPSDRYQQEVAFSPQISLYFREDLEDAEENYAPIDAVISFRVMGQTETTFSRSEAIVIGNRIKSEFMTGGGYRWHKGRLKVTYQRKDQGYQLSLNAFTESEAREVIRKILDLQNHTIDENYLTIHTLAQTPPTIPGTHVIFGETRRKPRKRPVGYVRFQYAELHLWGIPNAITLCDRTYRRRDPLVI